MNMFDKRSFTKLKKKYNSFFDLDTAIEGLGEYNLSPSSSKTVELTGQASSIKINNRRILYRTSPSVLYYYDNAFLITGELNTVSAISMNVYINDKSLSTNAYSTSITQTTGSKALFSIGPVNYIRLGLHAFESQDSYFRLFIFKDLFYTESISVNGSFFSQSFGSFNNSNIKYKNFEFETSDGTDFESGTKINVLGFLNDGKG